MEHFNVQIQMKSQIHFTILKNPKQQELGSWVNSVISFTKNHHKINFSKFNTDTSKCTFKKLAIIHLLILQNKYKPSEFFLNAVIFQEKRQKSIKYKIFILKMSRRKQIKTIQIVWSLAHRSNARN